MSDVKALDGFGITLLTAVPESRAPKAYHSSKTSGGNENFLTTWLPWTSYLLALLTPSDRWVNLLGLPGPLHMMTPDHVPRHPFMDVYESIELNLPNLLTPPPADHYRDIKVYPDKRLIDPLC